MPLQSTFQARSPLLRKAICVVALIIGFVYMQVRESRHPGALRRGASVLVGKRSDAEGDVDWDAGPDAAVSQAGV